MHSIDPIRCLISILAGVLIFAVSFFAALVTSMFIIGWDDALPTGRISFWIYLILSGVFSFAASVVVARLSY